MTEQDTPCPQPYTNTLVVLKPDALERSLVGRILSRFETQGLTTVQMAIITPSKELASKHYIEHEGRDYYDRIVNYFTRGKVVVVIFEGPPNCYKIVRDMIGTTFTADSPIGTIRGDFGLEGKENLIHGSDSNESAMREIDLWMQYF